MNKYALIKDNTVFQMVESEKKPDWPTMPDGHKPLFVLVPEGEAVETGFTYDKKTGKFTPYDGYDPNLPEPVQHEPTTEERLKELEERQLIQMAAQAEVFEAQQEETLIMFSALAEIFEILLGDEE